MRRSIRSSLFLLVAPFALTFTLVAWVVGSKIGPWLAQPLVADCSDKGYSAWFCNLQSGLMPWLFLGAGILILLSVTALLSLGLFRAHIKELQQDVLDFQKGHRNTLTPDAPAEMTPLIQLLNRILQAGANRGPSPEPASHREAFGSTANRPKATSHEQRHTDRRGTQPKAPPPDNVREPSVPGPASIPATPPEQPHRDSDPGCPPAPKPDPEDTEDLEVSLEELDADIDKALNEASPEPAKPAASGSAARPSPERGPGSNQRGPANGDKAAASDTRPSRNLAFPTRKCRKLIAMLGHRYPDVNFELITDVAESDPWTIREAELTEIFGHLLDNAGKWAESQVNIFLAIKGNMLVFGVADDGPGVDPEITPHLGENGFRVNPDEPAGEGLVTVRRSLDAHGGSLAFDRSRLGGLEVIAAIPGSPVPRHVGSRGVYH